MIPKKSNNFSDPSNYRPISLTSNIAKLGEKLISRRLKEFLKENKIIIKQQSGFREHRQTKDNLVHITQKIYESYNRKKKVFGIFFDISQAFDKVWHKGLLHKLANLKIPNYILIWIKNFLENRTFCIKCNEYISAEALIYTSVPQGSQVLYYSVFTLMTSQ